MNDFQSISRINRPATPPPLILDIGRYASTPEKSGVVQQAINTYCHLLREYHMPGTTTRIDFSQFADYIEAFLGTLDESQSNTVRVLREVHAFSTGYPMPPTGREQFDNAIWLRDIAAA